MQKSVPWWAYFLSFLVNIVVLFLFFTSFKFNLFNLKPRRKKVRVSLVVKSFNPHVRVPHTGIFSEKSSTEKKNRQKRKSVSKPQLIKRQIVNKKKKEQKVNRKTKTKQVVKKQIIKKRVLQKDVKKTIQKHTKKLVQKPVKKNTIPALTPEEKKLISERIKALERKKLKKRILSYYTALEAEKEARLKKLEEEYRKNALSLIKQILEENFSLPVYLKDKIDLSAIVSIDVDQNGRITYRFLQKAPEEEFNQAVEECLKISNPLPVEGPLHLVVKFKSAGLETIKK